MLPEIGDISHMLKLILFEGTENNIVPNFASVLLLSQSRMKIKYKWVKWILHKFLLQNIGYYFKLPPRMCTPHLVMEPVMGVYYGPHYKMGVAHNIEFGYILSFIFVWPFDNVAEVWRLFSKFFTANIIFGSFFGNHTCKAWKPSPKV